MPLALRRHCVGLVALALVLTLPGVALFADVARDVKEGAGGRTGVFRIPETQGTSLLVPDGALALIFKFSGVTDDGAQGAGTRRKATSVHCTNFGATTADVEVQLYQWNGVDVFVGMASIAAGGTVTFSTQSTTIYFDDVIVGGGSGTLAINQGSGLVLSDSGSVVCTAQTLDPLGYPPAFVTGLEMHQ